jgi:hypothetical protein
VLQTAQKVLSKKAKEGIAAADERKDLK